MTINLNPPFHRAFLEALGSGHRNSSLFHVGLSGPASRRSLMAPYAGSMPDTPLLNAFQVPFGSRINIELFILQKDVTYSGMAEGWLLIKTTSRSFLLGETLLCFLTHYSFPLLHHLFIIFRLHKLCLLNSFQIPYQAGLITAHYPFFETKPALDLS